MAHHHWGITVALSRDVATTEVADMRKVVTRFVRDAPGALRSG